MQFSLEQAYPRRWRRGFTRAAHNAPTDVIHSLHDLIRRRSSYSTPKAPEFKRYDASFCINVPYGMALSVKDIAEITGYSTRKVRTEIRLGHLEKVSRGKYVNRCRENPPATRRLSRIRMVKWRYLVRQHKENTVTPETMAAAFGGTVNQWRENIGW